MGTSVSTPTTPAPGIPALPIESPVPIEPILHADRKNEGRMPATSARADEPGLIPRMIAALAALLTAAVPSALAAEAPASAIHSAPAQLVLIHGTILTVDAADSSAQALAIREGKIEAVGT